MDRAAAMLSGAWFRGWRSWWWAAALSLCAVLVLALGAAGLLDGMQRATEARVADFYTGELRVTVGERGAAPAEPFPFNTTAELQEAAAALAAAAGDGATVQVRLETTYVLSRRGLVEAYLFEDEQYGISLPGVSADRDAYSVGVLSGLDLADGDVRQRLRPYLLSGSFPQAVAQAKPGEASEPVQLLMSVGQFRSMLDPEERKAVEDVPTPGQLAALRLELTAARVDDSGPVRDIIRFPAEVVGVYASGIDTLDRITLVAPIEDVRRLLGGEPDGGQANVLTVHGPGAADAASHAQEAGWQTEGPAGFTQRYIGQLVDVVRGMGLALSALLLSFPFFMVWVGMAQQLDRNRRELAVCRAIGLPLATVRSALVRLSLRVLALALVPTLLLLGLASLVLPGLLSRRLDFPFPLSFHIPAWTVAAGLLLVAMATTVAVQGALRRHERLDINTALRAV